MIISLTLASSLPILPMTQTPSKSLQHVQRVVYIPPTPTFQHLDHQTRHGLRSSLVHSLITSTNLLHHCTILPLRPATIPEVLLAHNPYYLAVLHAASAPDLILYQPHPQLQSVDIDRDVLDVAGLVDDCAPFPGVWQLAMLTVGAAVQAVTAVIDGLASIACCFDAGRHHAAADSAHGFCYLNDAVVACKLLLASEKFSKVLYIDIDVHHGDGVEQAFLYNKSVTTLSFHLSETGFFPNTRSTLFPVQKHMKTDALRVPLRRGITDTAYLNIFKQVTDVVFRTKQPDVLVLQCGADALAGDPLGGFNLTHIAYVQAVQHILQQNVPVVILGGGGYVPENAARVWTDVLECCISWTEREREDKYVMSSREIPFTDEFFNLYAPSFKRDVRPLQIRDENDVEHLRGMVDGIRHALGDDIG